MWSIKWYFVVVAQNPTAAVEQREQSDTGSSSCILETCLSLEESITHVFRSLPNECRSLSCSLALPRRRFACMPVKSLLPTLLSRAPSILFLVFHPQPHEINHCAKLFISTFVLYPFKAALIPPNPSRIQRSGDG